MGQVVLNKDSEEVKRFIETLEKFPVFGREIFDIQTNIGRISLYNRKGFIRCSKNYKKNTH